MHTPEWREGMGVRAARRPENVLLVLQGAKRAGLRPSGAWHVTGTKGVCVLKEEWGDAGGGDGRVFLGCRELEPCSKCGGSCARFNWFPREACSLMGSLRPGWVRGCREGRDVHAEVCTAQG